MERNCEKSCRKAAVKVALIQMDLAWEDVEENHRRARRHLEAARERGARVSRSCPRCSAPGFSMDAGRIAQPPGGPSETFLRQTARELSLWILALDSGGGSAASAQHGSPGRPRRERLALREDPSLLLRRRAPGLLRRGEDRHGRRRGRPRDAVRLLRPALPRAVSPGGLGHGPLRGRRQLARARAARRGARCCARGRSRTSATSRASTARARAEVSATPATPP